MSFQCENTLSHESLCFFGTCNVSSCVCLPEWQHDNLVYHSEGCTIPVMVPLALWVIDIVLFLLCLIVFLVPLLSSNSLLPMVQSASIRSRCLRYGIVYTTLSNMQLMLWYLQGGSYEASIVVMNLATGFLGLWAWNLLSIVLTPLIRVEQSMAKKSGILPRVKAVMLSFYVLFLVVVDVVRVSTCRLANPFLYNLFVDILLSGSFVLFVFAGMGFNWLSARLEVQLEDVILSNSLPQLRADIGAVLIKVKWLQHMVWIFSLQQAICLLPWVISRCVLGSAPFSWVFFYGMVFGQQGVVFYITRSFFPAPMKTADTCEAMSSPPFKSQDRHHHLYPQESHHHSSSKGNLVSKSGNNDAEFSVVSGLDEHSPALLATDPVHWKT